MGLFVLWRGIWGLVEGQLEEEPHQLDNKKYPVLEVIHEVKGSQSFTKEGDGRRAPGLPHNNQILPVILMVPQHKTWVNHGIYWFVWNMYSLVSHYASGKLSFHRA